MRKYVDTNFPELPDVYESYFPKKPKFWHFLNEEKSGSPAAEPATKPLSIPGDTLSPVKTIGQPAKEPAMTFVVRQPAEMLYNPLALVRQQAALEGAAKPAAAPPEAAPPVEKPSAGVQREAPATQQEALGRRYVDEAVQRERFSTQYVERRGAAEWELMQHLPEEKRRAIEAELKSLDEWFDQESDTGVETPRAAPGNEAEAAGRQFVDRALRENRVSSEYTTRWSMLDTELLQMMPEERRRAIKAEQEAVGRWYDDEQAREAIKGTTAHRESPGTADEARGREIAELIERKNEVSAYYTSRWSYLDSLLLQMMPEERRKTIKAEQEALGKWFDDETDGNKEAAGPHNSEAVNREQKLRYYAERKRILQRELLIEIPDEKRFAIEAEATALERWFDAQGFGEREAIEADALRFSATGNPGFSSHRVFRKF
jgi:hypothetical protein